MRNALPYVLLFASIACFVGSLFLPAFIGNEYEASPGLLCSSPSCESLAQQANDSINPQGSSIPSLDLFVEGAFGIFVGMIGWYANPAYLFALFFFFLRSKKSVVLLSLLALALGVTIFFMTGIPLDEGGVREFRIHHPASGYYAWMGSFLLLLAAGLSLRPRTLKSPK